MRRLRAFLHRISTLAFGARRRAEFDAELQSHVAMEVDDLLRSGVPADQARRLALARAGGLESAREAYHDRATLPAIETTRQVLRDATRTLRRHPGFTAAVAVVLAIGVGANAAMFGLVDTLMFRAPDAVRDPDRLFVVEDAETYQQWRVLTEQSQSVEAAGYLWKTLSLGRGDAAAPIEAECVTTNYFVVTGAIPAVGRGLSATDAAAGIDRAVVISDGTWRRSFGSDPSAIGRTVDIAGKPYTIVGVVPGGFRGLGMRSIDAWVSLDSAADACGGGHGGPWTAAEAAVGLTVVGRLRDGMQLTLAEDEIRRLDLVKLRSASARPSPVALVPLDQSRASSVTRDARLSRWLAGGSLLILLIACANVAGLLSVRAVERRREIAVRLQVGASRRRVFLQLVTENLLLTAMCLIAAAAVAVWLGQVLQAYFPVQRDVPWMSARTLGVLALFGTIAGLGSGLVPALQTASSMDTAELWRSGQSPAAVRSRFRSILLVVQVALAIVLTIGAGLFARSVREAKTGLGYDLDRVAVAVLDLDRAGIRRQLDRQAAFARVLDAAQRLPGVESASLTTMPPLGTGSWAIAMPSASRRPGQAAPLTRLVLEVSADYFEVIGTRIQSGRSFRANDDAGAPPVAIVDAGLAAELAPEGGIVGRCITLASGRPCIDIIGVSEPRRYSGITQPTGEMFYPLAQRRTAIPQALLVRTRAGADDAVGAVAGAIREALPALPYIRVEPLESIVDARARSWRLGASMFGLFGGIALLLAAIGIYASLAFAIRQRTAEIGIRVALGAVPSDVASMVVRQGLIVIVPGVIAGAAAALALTESVRTLLFRVTPTDVTTFAIAAGVVSVAGLAGCVGPALRAMRVDPVVALRCE